MKTGFLLVGQLCTNPKNDRSLLSCLKVTQCSTSEIGDAPLYNWCSLPIQVMTTGPLSAPSKCKSGLPRITGTCPGWRKQSFRLQLWSLMWFQVRASEGVLRLCTLLSLAPLLPRHEPAGLLRLVIRREHHQHDLKQHQSQPDRCHPPSSRRRLWKGHAPSSGSVSRRWLRLKAVTLNRCQLYYIIKLTELIFSIKVLK